MLTEITYQRKNFDIRFAIYYASTNNRFFYNNRCYFRRRCNVLTLNIRNYFSTKYFFAFVYCFFRFQNMF